MNAAKLTLTPKLGELPVYVRAGTILPRQPLVQSTTQVPQGSLKLDVYPDIKGCRGDIYFDDGVHIGGPSLRQSIECVGGAKSFGLHFGPRKGSWRPWWKQIEIVVHGPITTRKIIADQPKEADVSISAAFD